MSQPSLRRKLTTDLGLEVERLVKMLQGAEESRAPAAAVHTPPRPQANAPRASGAVAASLAQAVPEGAMLSSGGARGVPASPYRRTAAGPSREVLIGAWARAGASATLGIAVLWWPYAHDCGWLLHAYLGVIAAVMITGGWASISAWRARVAAAHVVALVVAFWGVVLAAETILPRIGYAATSAIWTCGG